MKNKIKIIKNFMHSRLHALLNENPIHPYFIHFECTFRCNMKCSFCNIWRKNNIKNEATTEEMKNRLVECWNLGCSFLGVTGGEPLLRNDVGELLEFSSRNLGLITGLVTNGILLDKKIDKIAKFSDFLAVSFDVNNKQAFNKNRGVDAFETVKKNIKIAAKMGIEINLLSVITNESFEFMDDTIELAKSLELPIHFSFVDNVPREFVEISDSENLKVNDTDRIVEKLTEEKKNYKKLHFEKDYFRFQSLGGFNRFIKCSSASNSISLKPDASVALPCPFFSLLEIKKPATLRQSLDSEKARKIIGECGNFDFCKYCSINCMYVVSLINHPDLLLRWIKDKI